MNVALKLDHVIDIYQLYTYSRIRRQLACNKFKNSLENIKIIDHREEAIL
jgi:hypothetical protein